jgi:hypothetical protein
MGKNSSESEAKQFKSNLKTGAERFLAQAMVHAIADGWRTPEDFLRQFKPLDIMSGLETAADLRAQLLVKGAGVHERIARKKSTASAAEDLRIALDEGVTDGATILQLFPPDDRVRYLDNSRLWSFIAEDEFWNPLNAEANVDRAVGRMTFLLESALAEDLISIQDVMSGISYETIASRLPLKELQKIVKHALKIGRDRKPLTEDILLEVIPLRTLVGYIQLDHIWKSVIVDKIAGPAGYADSWDAAAAPARKESGPPPQRSMQPPVVEVEARRASVNPAQAPKLPPIKKVEVERAKADLGEMADVSDEEVDKLISGSQRPAPEEEARRRVIDKLASINRLPPRHDTLSTPILLSIESMYSELLGASSDEQREACIRDSFPNQSHLATALLALIELLDSSIDVNDPLIRDADVDSLIKVVLFEERHRYEQANPSSRSASPVPPPPPAMRRSSVLPPPLPRASNLPPPPPLPEQKRAR